MMIKNILTSVSMALQAEGYNVDTYPDGVAALQGIGSHPVDLAVLDIKNAQDGWHGAAWGNPQD